MKRDFYYMSQFRSNYSVSASTVYREIALGRLRVFKRNGKTLVAIKEAKRWNRKRRKARNRKFSVCYFVKLIMGKRRKCVLGSDYFD